MEKIATALLVTLALTAATSAMALDLHRRSGTVPSRDLGTQSITAFIGCDNGVLNSAYFQKDTERLGNLFDFGGGALLSRITFAHYGYGFSGPYSYDIELWDPLSCTFIASRDNLTAADAATSVIVEDVNLCQDNLFAVGLVAVTLDPNSCIGANDCYPDLIFDDQIDVICPFVIADATTLPVCIDASPYNGPFVLRTELDNCATPSKRPTWGQMKAHYR